MYILIPIVLAFVGFWAGIRFERIRREAELRKPAAKAIRKLPKRYDWKGNIY